MPRSSVPRPAVLLSCVLTVVLGTSACSSGSTPDDTSAAPASASSPSEAAAPVESPAVEPPAVEPSPEAVAAARVVIADFAYEVPASVPAGASVEVVNEDDQAHTVSLAGTDVSVVVQGGRTGELTAPTTPGSYAVACQFHGNMTATLVVV